MKKIFVAGASSERGEIAAAIALLRAAGWEIVIDWPELMKSEPSVKDPRFLEKLGMDLKNGMRRADIFWLLLPREKSEGAAFEFGFFSGYFDREARGGMVVSGDASALGRLYPYAMGAKGKLFAEHATALEYLTQLQ
jgi:hypothetical protein